MAIGTIAGAGIGAAVGGVPGAQVGGMIGGTIEQLFTARSQKKQAEESMLGYIDPEQSAFTAELQQKRKSIDTGSAYATGMSEAEESQASANAAIVGATGGDVAGTVDALIKAQRASGQAKNQILAQGDASQKYYTGLFGSMVDKIAQRKMELQLLDRAQSLAEGAQAGKVGDANTQGILARLEKMIPKKDAAIGGGTETNPASAFNAANPGIEMDADAGLDPLTTEMTPEGATEFSGLTGGFNF